jgi:hypothetical protein
VIELPHSCLGRAIGGGARRGGRPNSADLNDREAAQVGAAAGRAHLISLNDRIEQNNMIRSALVFIVSITLCAASADAATVHRSKPPVARLRASQRVTVPEHFTVPGWTEEETRKWMTFPEVTD